MKGKVSKVENLNDSWTNKYGTFDKYAVTIDNKVGAVNVKAGGNCPFKEGEEAEYEEKKDDFGYKFKFVQPKFVPNGKSSPSNNRSFALSYAKDIIVAQVRAGADETEQLFQLAEKMNDWLEGNVSAKEPRKEPPTQTYEGK